MPNKLLHADSIQLSRFLLKEKAAKTAPTYSPVSKALGDKMSAAPHVSAFVKGVAKNKEIWTIQFPDKSYIKWEKDDGTEIFPVWSTKSRVEKIISYEKAFEGASIVNFTYGEFLEDWMPQLIKSSTGLGPNWAGENIMGWEMDAQEIIGRIQLAIEESTKIT